MFLPKSMTCGEPIFSASPFRPVSPNSGLDGVWRGIRPGLAEVGRIAKANKRAKPRISVNGALVRHADLRAEAVGAIIPNAVVYQICAGVPTDVRAGILVARARVDQLEVQRVAAHDRGVAGDAIGLVTVHGDVADASVGERRIHVSIGSPGWIPGVGAGIFGVPPCKSQPSQCLGRFERTTSWRSRRPDAAWTNSGGQRRRGGDLSLLHGYLGRGLDRYHQETHEQKTLVHENAPRWESETSLKLACVDDPAVVAVAKAPVDIFIDQEVDRADRAVAEDHVAPTGVCDCRKPKGKNSRPGLELVAASSPASAASSQ